MVTRLPWWARRGDRLSHGGRSASNYSFTHISKTRNRSRTRSGARLRTTHTHTHTLRPTPSSNTSSPKGGATREGPSIKTHEAMRDISYTAHNSIHLVSRKQANAFKSHSTVTHSMSTSLSSTCAPPHHVTHLHSFDFHQLDLIPGSAFLHLLLMTDSIPCLFIH